MELTIIPTEFAVNEAMRSLACRTILAISEQHQLGPEDLERLAHVLAQREASSDAKTGAQHVHCITCD